ncbi:GNAT family N-acetyltransferase [Novosphingobium humi]|uniref:GNAT family N-acetyltransferase n=1 Tax=Novosphingobium humi TaxID=2282397 RepID=A0ABY7U200_9SPHN|nr:GNAT family N-acetyltransferase [Novosphingobium humi]WCT79155.1 GNAT family N-acetyltransferase [Novosphingobium humi]
MTINIRRLQEIDLEEADHIFRLAFGTFLGLPDPMQFAAGANIVGTRWRANSHNVVLGAYDGVRLVGSNIITRWGSFGMFGPLTVLPDYWDKGVGQLLMASTIAKFAQWEVDTAGLFTFPHSTKHLGLYQKFDFWPQRLTAIMVKPVHAVSPHAPPLRGEGQNLLRQAKAITDANFPGLDLSEEILALWDQNMGELVVVEEHGAIAAFAICHAGSGTEAGPDKLLIKFAATLPGRQEHFSKLLAACEGAAARLGLSTVAAGINTTCSEAYQTALGLGYRLQMTGVAMHRGNAAGYFAKNAFVISDWR